MEGSRLRASSAELRIWLADRMAGHNSSHTVANILRFHGPLNIAALRQAVSVLTAREPVARTTYRLVGDMLCREVMQDIDILQPEIDLRSVDRQAREQALAEVARRDALRPFDLAAGPLMRATIVRLGLLDNALLLAIHHIAVDRRSRQVLIEQLADLYARATQGLDDKEAPPEMRGPNVARTADHDTADAEKRVAYWRAQLAGASSIEFSGAKNPASNGPVAGRHDFDLDEPLVSRMRDLAHAAGCTLFMAMTAALGVLMSRATGSADIAIAVPIACQDNFAARASIGFDVDLGILRLDLGGDPDFNEVLQRTRKVILDAYRYAVPYDTLVDRLNLYRSGSAAPLSNVVFAFANEPDQPPHFGDCATSISEVPVDAVKFPLAISLLDRGADVQGIIEHELGFLSGPAVGSLVLHLKALIDEISQCPHCPIWDLSLTSGPSPNVREGAQSASETHHDTDTGMNQGV